MIKALRDKYSSSVSCVVRKLKDKYFSFNVQCIFSWQCELRKGGGGGGGTSAILSR